MTKISQLISKTKELEREIVLEEKKILKNAIQELQIKLESEDPSVIDMQNKIIAKQEKDFNSFSLQRDKGIEKLNKILAKLIGRDFNTDDSEHLLLFSSLSVSSRVPSKILEIGTADGITAATLALLFPNSEVVTIDLPIDNDKFRMSYDRAKSFKQYVDKRDRLLNNFENLTFSAINSISLNSWSDKSFDLIWVDGAHGFPVLPLDLYNSFRLIRKGGLVVIDDVFVDLRKLDDMYRSTAAIQTLKLFHKNDLISNYKLIRKRLSLKFNFKDLNEKFLAVVDF